MFQFCRALQTKFVVKLQMNYLIYSDIYQPDIQSTASKTRLEETRALALNIYFISMPEIFNFVVKKRHKPGLALV